jgi:hypothetical protein
MYSTVNKQTSYIENKSWEEFLADFAVYCESEFHEDNPLRTIFDMPDDNTFVLEKVVILMIDKALSQYNPQKVMDDFLMSCIESPRYIMDMYELVENVIRYLLDKGAEVSLNIVLKPLYDPPATLEDCARSLTIRGFIYHKFLRCSWPISYSAVYWEDRYDEIVSEENFLGAVRYEAENLWMYKV